MVCVRLGSELGAQGWRRRMLTTDVPSDSHRLARVNYGHVVTKLGHVGLFLLQELVGGPNWP